MSSYSGLHRHVETICWWSTMKMSKILAKMLGKPESLMQAVRAMVNELY